MTTPDSTTSRTTSVHHPIVPPIPDEPQVALLPPLPAPVDGTELTEIAPGYYTFRWLGTRTIFLVTQDGVIVADPINEEATRLMRDAIRSVTDLPVRTVVYSHQHWDHVVGGQLFKEEGATFVAHARAAGRFLDLPHPAIVPPDVVFDRARHDITLGGRTLQLSWLGPNHGEGLVIMQPADVPIPFVVDLATPGGMPLPTIPDYSLHHWIRSLRELEGWGFDQYISGHGVPIAPTIRMTERRQYLEALLLATRDALEGGADYREAPDIVADALRPRFANLRGYDGIVRGNVGRVLSYFALGW